MHLIMFESPLSARDYIRRKFGFGISHPESKLSEFSARKKCLQLRYDWFIVRLTPMKICPACSRMYADESMSYCLDDGSVLSAVHDPQKTLDLPSVGGTAESVVTRVSVQSETPETVAFPAPTVASPAPTIPAMRPRAARDTVQTPSAGGSKWLPGVLIGMVIGVGGAGLIGGVMYLNRASETSKVANSSPSREIAKSNSDASTVAERSPTQQSTVGSETPTPASSRTATPTPEPSFAATPRTEKVPATPKPDVPLFGPMSNNVSLEGTNLTYYRGSTAQSCQADCAANLKCRGFTYIRPGGYNPGDPAMCYLASAVTGRASHSCCISGVKR